MKALRQNRPGRHKAKHIPLWPGESAQKVQSEFPFTKIAFQVLSGVEFVDPLQVTHLEAQSNYTIIHSISGRRIMVSKTLKGCTSMFPRTFLRIHHSYLINPNHIQTYLRQDHACRLDNGLSIPVSRSGKNVMQEFLKGC